MCIRDRRRAVHLKRERTFEQDPKYPIRLLVDIAIKALPGWIFPTPTWEDYLTLAFDEIRHFGSSSVQVMRRMRSALVGLAASLPSRERAEAVRRYIERLDLVIEASPLDVEDKRMARQEDQQGIGLSRRHSDAT